MEYVQVLLKENVIQVQSNQIILKKYKNEDFSKASIEMKSLRRKLLKL